ncbi:LOW QUALITY PROTEIN: hypothetical protein Cgig2_018412 [Carnegiea gigantea]|uniref:DUF4283 domain-containing protein n=1 Tax=Carnegiea gigantea TaxID=171969 RepID=A0A9Q1JFA9_9CARY|nr:LOW QUALITY PROTEIN: hypothetical protein Cgig2_018412 [Carnegiea gigantea]
MATDIEEARKRLSLTAEEDVAVECEDKAANGRSEQIALCLWGNLHTDGYFNVNAMKTVFKNVWKPSKGVIIRDLDRNLFAFQFFSSADRDYALNEGPWAFDGNILMLKSITGYEQPLEVQFTHARCDDSNIFCAADKSVNFQVDIDITKPLCRGMKVLDFIEAWWDYSLMKEVNLARSFATVAAGLATPFPSIRRIRRSMTMPISHMAIGSKAPPSTLQTQRRGLETRREMPLPCLLPRLLFYKPQEEAILRYSPQPTSLTANPEESATAPDKMLVDNTLLLQPRNEAFKRKLGSSQDWHFTVVYGYPESQHNFNTCHLISDVHTRSDLPWIVGGDINVIFFNCEKKGGPEKSQAILDHFRDTFIACHLHDLR